MNSKGKENQVLFQENLIKAICPQFCYSRFMAMLDQFPQFNYSLGCMFGSFMGDSLGSYVQFSKKLESKSIKEAMDMTPGGTFNLRSGQVTDDSQMSFHLLDAITKFNVNEPFSSQKNELVFNIAEQYVKWRQSKPFDIGLTCRAGIEKIRQILKQEKPKNKEQKENVIKKIHEQVGKITMKSQSNGSLMKITPLVYFAVLLSMLDDTKQNKLLFNQFVKDEIQLIHSSPVVRTSSLGWYAMLTQICIRKTNQNLKQIYTNAMQYAKKHLQKWADQVKTQTPMSAQQHQGWAKIAWSYGMRDFKQIVDALEKNPKLQLGDYTFKSILKNIISLGGDTDTNAAIIGGMLGSMIGFKGLPKDYIAKMFALDFSNEGLKRSHDRLPFYQPRRVFVKIYQFTEKMVQKHHRPPAQKAKY